MFSRESRVGAWFFTKSRKPDFFYRLPSVALRVYKNGPKLRIVVIISKKVLKTAVARNSLKRKIFGFLEKYKKNLRPAIYIVYPQKGFLEEEIKKELQIIIEEKFLDNSQDVV